MNEKDLYNNSNFDYYKLDDNTNPNSNKFNEKDTEIPLLLEKENKKNPIIFYNYLNNSNYSIDDYYYSDNSIEVKINSLEKNFIFHLFLIGNMLLAMDHGIIPASTEPLRRLSNFDQTIGLFGSLVYFGNMIGSIIVFKIIDEYNRKFLLNLSFLINSICLLSFTYFENIPFLFLNRIITGMFQSFINIYLPVWANAFGEKNKRTMMIAEIQLMSPIGIFLGYLIAAIFINNDPVDGWEYAFIIQAVAILVIMVVFFCVPNVYFDNDVISVNVKDNNNKEYEKFVRIKEKTEMKFHINNLKFKEKLSLLLSKKVFLFSVLALSVLIYVISGIQYWISDYMNNILLIKSAKNRLFYFTIICFTAPTLGVLIGSITKNYFCQTSIKKSLIFILILSILASLNAFLFQIVDNLIYFIITMWLILFFGGGIVPVLTNVIIDSVPKKLEASGNSITNLLCNLLGYLPAPYVYGILNDIIQDKGRISMKFTMWYSFAGVIFISLACYYNYDKKNE
jgi:MFS family permease